MRTDEDLSAKRSRLLALAADIPSRCRLVEQSPGAPAARKLLKLKLFGKRYLVWAMNRLKILRTQDVRFPLFFGKPLSLPFKMEDDFVMLYLTGALGGPEYKLIRFFIKNFKPEDVFYDVGASYGLYTFLAGEFMPDDRIHSFEPSGEIYRRLVQNARGAEHINNLAVSDKQGECVMYTHHLSHGFNTIEPEMARLDPSRTSSTAVVQSTALDEYVKNHAAPTIMKVDIEGAEDRLIEGARRCLESAAPVVAMEIMGGERGLSLSLRAIGKMIGLGYAAHSLSDSGDLESPLSASGWEARINRMTAEARDQIAWDNAVFKRSR